MTSKSEQHSILGKAVRFFAWWFGFSSLYAMFAVCPVCGQVGCPIGAGSAGIVGGFFALLLQDWKVLIRYLSANIFRRTNK